ncbi:MAG: hypothetical protein ACK4WC_03475 [Rubrimonas sp.]
MVETRAPEPRLSLIAQAPGDRPRALCAAMGRVEARGGAMAPAQNLRSRVEVYAKHARASAVSAQDPSRLAGHVAAPEGHARQAAHVPMFPPASDGAPSRTGGA